MQRSSTAICIVIGLALLLSFTVKATYGQAVTGTLIGTVQDQTGAIVPNAHVTLTNEGTNVMAETTSSQQGFYTFPNLNPGSYTVSVEAPGFKNVISRNNIVQVQKTTSVDITLAPGAVSTKITVRGQTPLIQTTTSDLGMTITQAQLKNLPISGRVAALLLQLAPGTTPAAWGAGNPEDAAGAASTAPGGAGGGVYTSANGFPFEGNLYLVDGVTDVELANAYMGIQIPFAMIAEVKVETSNPSAEYGTFGGMISNVTTKSGTNSFHGQLFEYNRNTDFNARDHFSGLNPPFHSNQFGGEIDGPIIKNKLFFAGDLQWLKQAQGASGIWSLPTAAARTGDLSGFVVNGAGPITNPMACYYSAVANGLPGAVPCTASPAVTVAGTYDTVPSADIVPIAKNFFQSSVWPLPNLPGSVNNSTFVQLTDASFPQEDVRVDYPFSQHDHFFARMSYGQRAVTQPLHVGNDPSPAIFMNDGNANATNQLTNDVVGWDHIFSPNMMNQLRIGYSRFATSDFDTAYGTSENNVLGVPNGNIGAWSDTSGIAAVYIGGFNGTGDPGWVPNTLGRLSNIYQLDDAFTLVKGRNDLKFGVSIQPIQSRYYNAQDDPRGVFATSGNFTGNGSNGASVADWLVGALSSVTRDHFFDKPNTRIKYYGFFGQDDVRVTQGLTLNLGLRYDIYTFPVDKNNMQSNFVTSGPDAGMIQMASSSNRSPNVNNYYGDVSPRLGFAYTPDNGKTAFRGAFGVSYFPDNFGANSGTLESNYPEDLLQNNSAASSGCADLYSGPGAYTGTGLAKYSQCGSLLLANGLPGNTGTSAYSLLVPPSVAPGGAVAPLPGFGVFQMPVNFRQDEAASWNISLERQLGPVMSIHAAYVGTAGYHLYHDYQLNQCDPTAYTIGPTYSQLQAQYGTSVYPNFPNCMPFYGIAPTIATMDYRASGGKSHYNAGQFVFQRHQGTNLTFTAAYTWSKMMDNISNPIDSYSAKEEEVTAGWQRNNYPQVLTLTYVYTLPFGRGQRFAGSVSPIENAVVGGWVVSGITNFRSGAPLLMTAGTGDLLPQNSGQRANYNCSSPANPHTVNEWFQTSCFSQPVGFVFGNAGVGEGGISGPRYQDWDMSVSKAIRLAEHTQVQFQAQHFNVFNHTNFQNPDTNQPDSSFGVISGDFLPRMGQLGMVFSF